MRYAKYKPTGIAWLPEVPEGWGCAKVSQHFRLRSEKVSERDYPALSVAKQGIVPQLEDVAISLAEGDTRKLVRKGDYVVNSRSDRKGSCGIAPRDGSVTTISIVLEPRNVVQMFIHYLFRSHHWIEEFYRHGRGIVADLWTTNYQQMKGMQFPLPPIPTQRAIVAYLDEKCGKVDRLVAAKEKEVALLKELKQSMIAEAVTHGVRPKRRLVLSGIPWLPEVPEGWEVKTLRQFLKMVSRKGFPEKQLLSVTREQGVVVRNVESKEENHNFIPEDLSNYKLVEVGDFAINKMKSWQGSYGVSEHEGIVSPAYYICKLSGVDRSYFSAAIRSRPYVSFFARFSKGIRVDQWDLSPIALKEIPFLLPPLDEQREIVAHIEARAAKIDAAVKGLEREVAALKEYKQRLIADVVTGQRKVA